MSYIVGLLIGGLIVPIVRPIYDDAATESSDFCHVLTVIQGDSSK